MKNPTSNGSRIGQSGHTAITTVIEATMEQTFAHDSEVRR